MTAEEDVHLVGTEEESCALNELVEDTGQFLMLLAKRRPGDPSWRRELRLRLERMNDQFNGLFGT